MVSGKNKTTHNSPTDGVVNASVEGRSAASRLSPIDCERKSYDRLTVLIPGTWAPVLGPLPVWYSPSAQPNTLHAYLRERVFPGEETYVYRWNRWGLTSASRHRQRVVAAEQLLQFLQSIQVKFLRVIGHSHGANIAGMITRDDLVKQCPGVHIDTLVMLNPAVDRDGQFAQYHPDMNHVGDLTVPMEDRRFFTFHSVKDASLGEEWAQDYQHTNLARNETLRGDIASDHHWASTFPKVWKYHQLAKLVRAE